MACSHGDVCIHFFLRSWGGVLRHALPPRVGASDDSSNEKKAPKRKAKAKSGKSKKQKDEEPDNEFEPLGGHDSDDHDSDPDSQGSGGNDDGLDSSRPAPNPRKRPACNSAKKKPSTKPRKHGDFITSEDKVSMICVIWCDTNARLSSKQFGKCSGLSIQCGFVQSRISLLILLRLGSRLHCNTTAATFRHLKELRTADSPFK